MQKMLFKLLVVLFIMYIAVFPLEITLLFQILMFCVYTVVLIIGVYYIMSGKYNKIDLLLQFFIIQLIIIEAIINQIDVNLNNLQSLLGFFALVIILGAHNSFKVDKNIHKFIFNSGIILAIILNIYSFMPFAYNQDSRKIIYLTLNLGNSNFTGIILFCTCIMIWTELPNRRYKLIPLLLSGRLIYLIYLTNSRASLLAVMFSIIYLIFLRRKSIPKWAIIVMFSIPFIFVIFYLNLYESGFEDYQILGKRFFSGRERIYNMYLNEISSLGNLLFGNMKNVFFLNTGNAPLAILCSTGIFSLLGFYTILLRNLLTVQNSQSTSTARTAIIAILVIILHSSSESAMFLGGITSLVYMYTFLVLTHDRSKDSNITYD